MARKDRAVILKDFYVNRFAANKAVAVMYLEKEITDFFSKYPFNSKSVKDYDRAAMRKHIVFDLCRTLGDAGFRLFELFNDYVDDLYNRDELKTCIIATFENFKLRDVN